MTQQAVTQKRQLRQSRPYWETTPKITLTTRQKPAHRHYDVIVVGAGISGALIAQALMDGKRKIAILDRRRPVFGSTMASTAMLQHEIDVPLFKLKKLLTAKAAERIWQRSADSVDALIKLTGELDINCSMQRKRPSIWPVTSMAHARSRKKSKRGRRLAFVRNFSTPTH